MVKKKNIKVLSTIIACTLALICLSGNSFAQQVPMYSQYIMNGFLINPSFAGRDGYTTVNLTVREQWTGLPQAPSTYALSFQTRVLNNSYISKTTTVKKRLVKPTKGGRVGTGGYVFMPTISRFRNQYLTNRKTWLLGLLSLLISTL